MRSQAGFTLLETLVALVVLSFIVVGLTAGMRFGLRAWDQQARKIDRDGALDATDRTLSRLIAGMVPGSDPTIPAVVGEADRLAFVATLPEGAPAAPIRLADVAIGVDAAHRLMLTWTPHLHAKILAVPPAHDAVLLPGVTALRLSYYGSAGEGHAPGWVSRWRGIDPPSLVRVHLDFQGGALHWPDLIVQPMQQRDDE